MEYTTKLISMEEFDKWIEKTNKIVEILKNYSTTFALPKYNETKIFLDKSLFIALNQIDLIIGMKNLNFYLIQNKHIEVNYFARILILNCHEILNDLSKYITKDERDILILNFDKELISQLDLNIKELNKLKKSHLKKLKDYRKKVVGHKEINALEQIKTITEIDKTEIYEIANQISKIQIKIIDSFILLISSIV